MSGWIGVDLDGTLAHYAGWVGPDHIGDPIPTMLARVRKWISEGRTVKIFTARCCVPEQVPAIAAWLERHGIGGLDITNVKDFGMVELWDDRAIQVVPNTGIRADGYKGLRSERRDRKAQAEGQNRRLHRSDVRRVRKDGDSD